MSKIYNGSVSDNILHARIAELEAERDELGLPAGIGPAPGELRRILDSLRQQLAEARRTAEYWKAEHLAGNEQLAAALAACKQKDEALHHMCFNTEAMETYDRKLVKEALAIQPDDSALRQQLASFVSAVEHVTEDGKTRRSFVAMPEGWAMVHKDRLAELEYKEEQWDMGEG